MFYFTHDAASRKALVRLIVVLRADVRFIADARALVLAIVVDRALVRNI